MHGQQNIKSIHIIFDQRSLCQSALNSCLKLTLPGTIGKSCWRVSCRSLAHMAVFKPVHENWSGNQSSHIFFISEWKNFDTLHCVWVSAFASSKQSCFVCPCCIGNTGSLFRPLVSQCAWCLFL